MEERMPESGVEVAPGVRVGEESLRYSFVRASGPGGQNVNKVSTRCVLRVAIADLPLAADARARLRAMAGHRRVGEEPGDELLLSCDRSRSQERNRAEVLAELRGLLVGAMKRPKRRKPTKPSRGSQMRRLEGKRIRSEVKRSRQGRE